MLRNVLQRLDVSMLSISTSRSNYFTRCLRQLGYRKKDRAACLQQIISRAFQQDGNAQLFLELGSNLKSARSLHVYVTRCLIQGIDLDEEDLLEIELQTTMVEASAASAKQLETL